MTTSCFCRGWHHFGSTYWQRTKCRPVEAPIVIGEGRVRGAFSWTQSVTTSLASTSNIHTGPFNKTHLTWTNFNVFKLEANKEFLIRTVGFWRQCMKGARESCGIGAAVSPLKLPAFIALLPVGLSGIKSWCLCIFLQCDGLQSLCSLCTGGSRSLSLSRSL